MLSIAEALILLSTITCYLICHRNITPSTLNLFLIFAANEVNIIFRNNPADFASLKVRMDPKYVTLEKLLDTMSTIEKFDIVEL